MRSMISGSKFVLAFIAGSHALKSSSIPQEGETISSEEQTPVLTVDSLVKDVEQKYGEGAEDIVNQIKYIVDDELRGNILGTNNDGQGFLYLVCRSLDDKSQAVVLSELLLSKYQCNPNTKDVDGEHALITAARFNRSMVAELLVQHGADINHPNDLSESTALHYAATRGHLQVVKVLLESGANTSLKNRHGMTAWQYAQNKNEHEVVAIFKSHELRKSFAVVLGLNHYTTQQIIAPKMMSNDGGLFKIDKTALLNILSFLKIKGE